MMIFKVGDHVDWRDPEGVSDRICAVVTHDGIDPDEGPQDDDILVIDGDTQVYRHELTLSAASGEKQILEEIQILAGQVEAHSNDADRFALMHSEAARINKKMRECLGVCRRNLDPVGHYDLIEEIDAILEGEK